VTPRALFVVERDFLVRHTGVLRVISHYRQEIEKLGYLIDFCFVDRGRLRLFDHDSQSTIIDWLGRPRRGTDLPWWTTGAQWRELEGPSESHRHIDANLLEVGNWVDKGEYALSLVTNPWLCEVTMPSVRFTHGLVYDLVPNLIAAQVLNLGRPASVWGFAAAHHAGYQPQYA
jgi:hypothetical protein